MRRLLTPSLAATSVAFANPQPLYAQNAAIAQRSGVDQKKLAAAVEWLKGDVERGRIPGAVVLVARDGKVLLHQAVGWADKEKKVPMALSSIHPIGRAFPHRVRR